VIEARIILGFEKGANVEPAGGGAICGDGADRSGWAMQTDEVLVEDEVLVVEIDDHVRAVLPGDQQADAAGMNMAVQLRKLLEASFLGGDVKVRTGIEAIQMAAKCGCVDGGIALADHDEVQAGVTMTAGIAGILHEPEWEAAGCGGDDG